MSLLLSCNLFSFPLLWLHQPKATQGVFHCQSSVEAHGKTVVVMNLFTFCFFEYTISTFSKRMRERLFQVNVCSEGVSYCVWISLYS
jgi:hypothetical protein